MPIIKKKKKRISDRIKNNCITGFPNMNIKSSAEVIGNGKRLKSFKIKRFETLGRKIADVQNQVIGFLFILL